MRRLLAVGLSVGAGLVLLFATTLLATSPASAASSSSGYCPTSKGVTVVADFTELGGGVETRCDPSATSATSGLAALSGAGFSLAQVQTEPGFVCRINSQPTDDHCIKTPPASAYWSYWYASDAGSWIYSSLGAASHKVRVGGLEGWRFHQGSGKASPPNKSTDRPVPVVKPTYSLGPAASATASHHTSGSSKSSSSTSSSTSPTSTATGKKSATATPTGTSTDPGVALATAGDPSSSSDPPQAGGKESAAESGGGSSPWPFLIGVVVVVVVGGGAGLVVYQRRRAGGI